MTTAPRCEISLEKIRHNVKQIKALLESKGMTLTAVTKGVAGMPEIARRFVDAGAHSIGDSHISNIRKMRSAGIRAQFMLTRLPMLSQAETVVRDADISLNSEITVLQELAYHAVQAQKTHAVVLMVELGDRREGILPQDLDRVVETTLSLKGLQLLGIGTNLACFGGVKPTEVNMCELSHIASRLQHKYGVNLAMISGGNSANYEWLLSGSNPGLINNLRIGEAILLGRETLYRHTIPELSSDAFTLIAEVIEFKTKASLPEGDICQNSFGEVPVFTDKGQMKRAILGIGKQDVDVTGLSPRIDVDVIGASSDHVILDAKDAPLHIGSEIAFDMSYSALLRVMTLPYVEKIFV